jgi:hypothetical protein
MPAISAVDEIVIAADTLRRFQHMRYAGFSAEMPPIAFAAI